MSLRLLITAAGSGTGFGYAKAKTRSFPDIILWTGDTHPADCVTASLFAERHLLLPAHDDARYFDELGEVFSQKSVDAYLPLVDGEVLQASQRRNELPVRVACPDAAFCTAAIAKSRYAEWLPALPGIRAIAPVRSSSWDGTPMVVKHDGGFGSRGTHVTNQASEANSWIEAGAHMYPFIRGLEHTVDCFPWQGDVVVSVRQRLKVKSGVCVQARIVQSDTLHALASFFTHHFELATPFCFQTIEAQGVHHVIDINPRLGAGTVMSAVNGTDFFSAHLAMLAGHNAEPFLRRHSDECVVTRQYTEFLMSVVL